MSIECYNQACPMHSVHTTDPDKEPICTHPVCVLNETRIPAEKLAACKTVETVLATCGVTLDEFSRYTQVRQQQVFIVWGADDVKSVYDSLPSGNLLPLYPGAIRKVLDSLWEEHDADVGVSLDSIAYAVTEFLYEPPVETNKSMWSRLCQKVNQWMSIK